jgi:hypothetical protein
MPSYPSSSCSILIREAVSAQVDKFNDKNQLFWGQLSTSNKRVQNPCHFYTVQISLPKVSFCAPQISVYVHLLALKFFDWYKVMEKWIDWHSFTFKLNFTKDCRKITRKSRALRVWMILDLLYTLYTGPFCVTIDCIQNWVRIFWRGQGCSCRKVFFCLLQTNWMICNKKAILCINAIDTLIKLLDVNLCKMSASNGAHPPKIFDYFHDDSCRWCRRSFANRSVGPR